MELFSIRIQRTFQLVSTKIIAKKRFSYLRNYYICTDYYTMA